jgi:hypothetical protein
MIQNNSSNKNSLKEIKDREKAEREAQVRTLCEEIAAKRAGGSEALIAISNKSKGLWYLPALTDEGQIDKLLVMKPIDRNILSFASTKITDEGLYAFLEAAMRECIIAELSDDDMMSNDEYFISAANSFNKIMDGKKTMLVKR